MFGCGNPIHDNLSLSERIEFSNLNRKMSEYVSSIDSQRKSLKEVKTSRDKIESMISHSLRPTDEEMFRQSDLWWKAYA